ncbi:MAG: ribonuclease P protein component [Bacteroidales bacterium]|jgi:ribonuclease P protein component|nr:ribonuclease P protein component [Bacteroidales bacterium]
MFLKAHRIYSEKDRENLFTQGNSHVEFPFKFVWTFTPATNYSSKLLISVPKKRVHHAVDRNFVKRHIRETFRLFENNILSHAPCGELRIAIIFMSDNSEQCKSCKNQLIKGLTKIIVSTNS